MPAGAARRQTARKGSIVDAACTVVTIRVNADRRANALSNPARGLGFRQDHGPGARRPLVASRRDKLGAGFQRRQTPLVMGSRGERSLPWSWSSGEALGLVGVLGRAGTPFPKRGSKRRTFRWRDEAGCRRAPKPGGCNGGAQRSPCQDCGVLHRTSCTSRYPLPSNFRTVH